MSAPHPAWQDLVLRAVAAAVVATLLSPMVRGITADLTVSVGTTWPFAMEHCRTADTPGCGYAEAGQWLSKQVATR